MSRNRLRELTLDALSIDGRVIVVGDLHGDYESFQGICKLFSPVKDCLVFLGDYADRGLKGVEVIEDVMDLREKYPTSVFALKGNHEAYTEDGRSE
jgi:predicted phosphodiesterase